MYCCVLLYFVFVNHTQILQGYFSGTSAMIVPVPNLKNLGKLISHESIKDNYVITVSMLYGIYGDSTARELKVHLFSWLPYLY